MRRRVRWCFPCSNRALGPTLRAEAPMGSPEGCPMKSYDSLCNVPVTESVGSKRWKPVTSNGPWGKNLLIDLIALQIGAKSPKRFGLSSLAAFRPIEHRFSFRCFSLVCVFETEVERILESISSADSAVASGLALSLVMILRFRAFDFVLWDLLFQGHCFETARSWGLTMNREFLEVHGWWLMSVHGICHSVLKNPNSLWMCFSWKYFCGWSSGENATFLNQKLPKKNPTRLLRARHACNVWRKLVLCRGTLCGAGRHGKAFDDFDDFADHELRASDGMALSGDLRDWSIWHHGSQPFP